VLGATASSTTDPAGYRGAFLGATVLAALALAIAPQARGRRDVAFSRDVRSDLRDERRLQRRRRP
jgi:hypothetical protein